MKYEEAIKIGRAFETLLEDVCEHITLVGSLRRKNKEVKDIEFVIVPKVVDIQIDLFTTAPQSEVYSRIARLLEGGIVQLRKDNRGAKFIATNKPQSKFVALTYEGLGVDLFIANQRNRQWQIVLRTGPREANMLLMTDLRPNEAMISDGSIYIGGLRSMFEAKPQEVVFESERAVFAFFGLPYILPENRSPETYLEEHNKIKMETTQ